MPTNSSASSGIKWPAVNRSEESLRFEPAPVCRSTDLPEGSPIDAYLRHTRTLLIRAAGEFESDPVILRLLVLEVVSAAEFYFRSLIAGLVSLCPFCARAAVDRMIPFGAIEFYGTSPAFGLLDNVSLATAGEVQKYTRNITGLEIKTGSSVAAALAEYDRVCHLRHAIVHGRSILGPRNIAELELSITHPCSVSIDTLGFQSVIAVIHNAVRAYNAFVFAATLARWVNNSQLTGAWRVDRRLISALCALFVSVEDTNEPFDVRAAYKVMQRQLRTQGRWTSAAGSTPP